MKNFSFITLVISIIVGVYVCLNPSTPCTAHTFAFKIQEGNDRGCCCQRNRAIKCPDGIKTCDNCPCFTSHQNIYPKDYILNLHEVFDLTPIFQARIFKINMITLKYTQIIPKQYIPNLQESYIKNAVLLI